MSITWLSRRESPVGAVAEAEVASDLLGISVEAMGNRLRVKEPDPVGVLKNQPYVLKIQQWRPFVKREVLMACPAR
jgi:hypothetical protein